MEGDHHKRNNILLWEKVGALLVIISLALALGPRSASAADEATVIGRIIGTHRELPGFFFRNADLLSQGMESVEFYGFRLINSRNAKTFLIRPNHEGYFYQDLPGGEYTLTRKRVDRPHYREPGTIDILSFEARPGSLVNLGTIDLILEGEPTEVLFTLGRGGTRGRYTYRYRYERAPGQEAFSDPLMWFTDRKPHIATALEGRTVRVDTKPTQEKDGSELTLREIIRFPDW